MNIEELQDKIEGIMTPMPPETYVQYYIDNDLLPSEKDKVLGRTTASWSKENPYKICSVCDDRLGFIPVVLIDIFKSILFICNDT